MGAIYLQECDDDAVSQKWFVMDDGRIALEASQRSEFPFHLPTPC